MDPNVLGILNAGADLAQRCFGEIVTLAGTDYTCSESSNAVADLMFEQGGASDTHSVSLMVTKHNLADPPERGTLAIFRGLPYRVTLVTDVVTSWDIRLVQQFA